MLQGVVVLTVAVVDVMEEKEALVVVLEAVEKWFLFRSQTSVPAL
jgi:hypothetical protein